MLKELLCLVVAVAAVRATGDLMVLHSPDSVVFSGNEKVEQSLLKEIFAAAVGCTVRQRGTWAGMFITDPFDPPEAVVAIVLDGMEFFSHPKGDRFPLIVNEVEETTWQALRERLEERDSENTLVRISLGDGLDALGHSALGELKPITLDETSLKALSLKREEDKKYVEEIQLMNAIAANVPTAIKPDSKPDIYWLVVSGLRAVCDVHGSNSTEAREALLLLNNALNVLSDAFIKAYDGKVIITAFTNDASQVRHSRSVPLNRQTRDADPSAVKNKSVESTSEAKGVGNNTEFANNKVSLKQDDREDESKKVEDEGETNTNTDSTSESNSDIDTSTVNNSLRDDSEESEKSDKEHETHIAITYTGQTVENLSKGYGEDYPVIFNIMLWFGVAFFFSLLAVCIAIADMDPGRDSIIYRMTSNRMKKDN